MNSLSTVKSGKRLVFWGTGAICQHCLFWNKDIEPEFFIDSNKDKVEYYGKKVVHPDDILNWKELFVVITVLQYEDIARYLGDKGLLKKEDYEGYDYFFTNEISIEDSLNEANSRVEDLNNSVMVIARVFSSRQHGTLLNFFKGYSDARRKEGKRVIFFVDLDMITEETAEKYVDTPVIKRPKLCSFDWDNRIDDEYSIYKDYNCLLSDDEEKKILEIESRKVSTDREKSLFLSKVMYSYLKRFIDIVKPQKVVIWGNWDRFSYFMDDILTHIGIPHGFMEYGWLPGTYQFDRRGIAGQSEYAGNSDDSMKKYEVNHNWDLLKIKECIISNKIDTEHHMATQDDLKQLKKIDLNRKTVFLVGMGDKGIGIDPQSDYWNQYISNVVKSTHEAAQLIYNVCKKNNWNFIFKPHPNLDNHASYDELSKKDDCAFVKMIGVDDLIRESDVVISIQSAVDYRGLLYQKPLVLLGHSAVEKQGCAYVVEGKEYLEDCVFEAISKGMTEQQSFNFDDHLRILLERNLWDDGGDRDYRYGQNISKDFWDI